MGIPISENTVLVSVYGWWQPCKGEPFDRAPAQEAQRLIDEGLAKSCRRGTAIQLLKQQWQWALRGESCKVTPRMMERFALGCRRAIAIIESWA